MQNQLTNNNLNYKNNQKRTINNQQSTIKGKKFLFLNAVVFIEPKFL